MKYNGSKRSEKKTIKRFFFGNFFCFVLDCQTFFPSIQILSRRTFISFHFFTVDIRKSLSDLGERRNCLFEAKKWVLRQRYECQHAECKGAERQSAEYSENDKVPKCQIVHVLQCRTVKLSMFYSAEPSNCRCFTVPKRHYTNVIKCRTSKWIILSSLDLT
jgi:hypothetical protein